MKEDHWVSFKHNPNNMKGGNQARATGKAELVILYGVWVKFMALWWGAPTWRLSYTVIPHSNSTYHPLTAIPPTMY